MLIMTHTQYSNKTKNKTTTNNNNNRSKPLQIWGQCVKNGHIKRLTDDDIQSSVLEISGTNVSTTYIQCPKQVDKNGKKFKSRKKNTLGIKLPFLVMIIKNLKKQRSRKKNTLGIKLPFL